MADESKTKSRLEIAHVLFMDMVGYSKLLTDEQSEALQELNQIVRNTEAARTAAAAGQLTILPTGDGMALVFTGSVEEPVECALELSHALRAQPSLPVRMGIHSGPVHHVKDANERENIAGVGINIAQRVMDCGDAGHILISKRVADDLAQQRRWQPYLHELGDVEVKHGVVVSLVNLYAETIGNPNPPTRIGKVRGAVRSTTTAARKGLSPLARAIFILAGLLIALAIVSVIFAPAIMRTLEKPGLTTLPQPSATASPSLADTIKSAVAKKITDELRDEFSGKKNAAVEPSTTGSAVPEKSIAVPQFVNVADGYHLWSEDYDGDVKDIFTFQSNVAKRVVDALQMQLGTDETRALTKKPTENPEAYRLYLLGRNEFGKYSEAGWTSSIRYYEQALKLDPNYALAYCGLADTYAYMGGVVMPSKEAVAKEKDFAQKALELDPELPEAHLSLACALGGAFDWRNAQIEFDRAIELNPNLAWAYEIYAWFLGGLGRLDEAIAKDKKAIELDPLNSFFQSALAYFLYHARRYDDAIVQIKKTLELDPASTLGRHLLGCCLLWKGDTAGAIAEFQRSKIVLTGAWYQGLLGYAYAISGDRPKAEQMLRELEEMAKRQYVNSTAFAAIYLGLGEKEKALDWLDKSYQDQESACWYLKVDPIYDSVRNEPRFQALVQKVFRGAQ